MNRDLTKGPVMASMLRFAVPMILGDLLQQCYNGANHASAPFRTLRLKGLDPDLRYAVNGEGAYPGDVLMYAGWALPMPSGDYRALQLYLEVAAD